MLWTIFIFIDKKRAEPRFFACFACFVVFHRHFMCDLISSVIAATGRFLYLQPYMSGPWGVTLHQLLAPGGQGLVAAVVQTHNEKSKPGSWHALTDAWIITKYLIKPNSSLSTAITALFLKTYFFKLASDVSGEKLLRQRQRRSPPRHHKKSSALRLDNNGEICCLVCLKLLICRTV